MCYGRCRTDLDGRRCFRCWCHYGRVCFRPYQDLPVLEHTKEVEQELFLAGLLLSKSPGRAPELQDYPVRVLPLLGANLGPDDFVPPKALQVAGFILSGQDSRLHQRRVHGNISQGLARIVENVLFFHGAGSTLQMGRFRAPVRAGPGRKVTPTAGTLDSRRSLGRTWWPPETPGGNDGK